MKPYPTAAASIDEYIASFPPEIQVILEEVRQTICNAAPEAREIIKYAMPTFVLNGNLVYFGAFKQHIGFYPVPSGIAAFKKELSAYKMGKGSIQFPFDKPMPLDLITEIVKFRVSENFERQAAKKTKRI
jgi:uncharacterized protein YdhG (YjbR/CyaY superfamily)